MAVKRTTNKKTKQKDNKLEDFTETSWGVEKDGLDVGKDIRWEATKGEVHSTTNLEDDTGEGREVVIRCFKFQLPPGIPETPSNETLAKAHQGRIEAFLWQDGLELVREPVVVMGKKGKFEIFAIAVPSKGNLIWNHKPQTLTQITNGPT